MSVRPVFGEGVFPFGTHVYREPCLDLDGVLRDLPLLKDYGFNMVKIQEHWSADERREGEYDFSRVEQVVKRAGELDLGIYLGLTMEQAPPWIWKKFPDCHFVYSATAGGTINRRSIRSRWMASRVLAGIIRVYARRRRNSSRRWRGRWESTRISGLGIPFRRSASGPTRRASWASVIARIRLRASANGCKRSTARWRR